ncbi:MAG: GGDEF domain-containing protein [Chloroflexota bacterium]|nr:GGDEF domain-containing protein [Chloroflexota bacterium]
MQQQTDRRFRLQPAGRLLLWMGLAPVAVGVLLLFPPLDLAASGPDAPSAWLAPASAAIAALAAAAATLGWLVRGLYRQDDSLTPMLRAAGFGSLTSGFATIALVGSGAASSYPHPAAALGLAVGSIPFLVAAVFPGRELDSRGARIAAVVALALWVEAVPAIGLLGGDTLRSWTPFIAEGAAAALFLAAGREIWVHPSGPAAGWLAGLGGATIVLAVARVGTLDAVVGTAAVSIAAAAAAIWAWRTMPAPQTTVVASGDGYPEKQDMTSVAGHGDSSAPAADDEPSLRLARELRGTIAELLAARQTIELQRSELERVAAHDAATSVASRRAILDRLRAEVAEARRYTHPVALAMLDLDGLSELNRAHGVAIGDVILRELALRLRLRMREADALGRVTGDTFLAILPHTDEQGAAVFADALLTRLTAKPVSTDAGQVHVTVSIGLAIMRPGMELTADELLARAEEALASARSAGGNRIAFDRLHGLARIDDRRHEGEPPVDGPAGEHDGGGPLAS